MTQKIIRNYSAFMLFEGLALSFFFGTYQLFLVDKGLNLLEINLLNCAFMLANFLFEIPTGAIADFFGRKKSVIFGLWVYSLSFFIYFFSDSFWQFLLAEIIGAFAFSCISGALEALVVDSLKHHKYDGNLETVFRRGEIRHLGIIIGAVAGSFVGQIDLSWPWFLTAVSFAFLAIASHFFFSEDYFSKVEKIAISFEPMKKIARESIVYGLKNRKLMFIVVFSSILAFILQPINMYWPIVFQKNFLVETKYMGLIFSAVVVITYLGSQASSYWQEKIKCKKNAIFFSQIITSLGIIFCFFAFNLSLFFLFFLLHEFGRGLFHPLNRAYINENIESKNRSTVLSFESMIIKAGSGLGLIFSGLIASNFGILNSWLISAIILMITIFVFWRKNGN
ncbi:MAG: MFS transporter [Patescibacteria group bacterium]|nr:MFS transporter [Patescibacteria group bacterium]